MQIWCRFNAYSYLEFCRRQLREGFFFVRGISVIYSLGIDRCVLRKRRTLRVSFPVQLPEVVNLLRYPTSYSSSYLAASSVPKWSDGQSFPHKRQSRAAEMDSSFDFYGAKKHEGQKSPYFFLRCGLSRLFVLASIYWTVSSTNRYFLNPQNKHLTLLMFCLASMTSWISKKEINILQIRCSAQPSLEFCYWGGTRVEPSECIQNESSWYRCHVF